jgi:DNA helicase HerA-like ATPase
MSESHTAESSSVTYLRVKPSDTPLSPHGTTPALRRLHSIGEEESGGLLGRFAAETGTTVECLLLATDETVTYAFGTDGEVVGTLERALRSAFPDTYEIEETALSGCERVLEADGDTGENGGGDGKDAAIEFRGVEKRRQDWQTGLEAFASVHENDDTHVPLASVVETMADADVPMVYQALVRPKADWSSAIADREFALEHDDDTLIEKLINLVTGYPEGDSSLTRAQRERLEALADRNPRHSFALNARVFTPGGADAVSELTSVFGSIDGGCYSVEGTLRTGEEARSVRTAIRERTFRAPDYERLGTHLPWTPNESAGIVADLRELGNFCLLGGGALDTTGMRGLSSTPGERTALPRPPDDLLERYRGAGMLLGQPLTQDGTAEEEPLYLPPSLQSLHVGWFGRTGSGKSVSFINAMLANHAATDGVDVLVEPKGDGMAIDYLRAHYAEYGTLENVRYFDCSEVLPAFSFFDIRDELDAGVPRTTAVEDTVDHYIEILRAIMGADRFEQAVRSPDIIRYLLKAMFDPVNGQDAFTHREFHGALRRMHERQSAPAVSDTDLERMLAGVVANRTRSFDEIMQGVANRIEKIPVDERLARVFNHVANEDGPAFDLADHLSEDTVIVFDTGGLRSESQRVLTLLILSNLWTALRRRAERTDGEHPLVNVYIEEAASIAVSDLLQELLSKSRGFGCSITLSMQFPAQLRAHGQDVYDEVLNDVSTFLTGNVPHDKQLAERLATEDMDPQEVANRLRALERGQWLASLPGEFGETEPRPFLLESAPLPPALADDTDPLADPTRGFNTAFSDVRQRTLDTAGLELDTPGVPTGRDSDGGPADVGTTDQQGSGSDATRMDSALPYTNRMPTRVEYDESSHALRCRRCDSRYDPDSTGMKRALSCCGSLEDVDTDDVPVCELHLKLSPEERELSDWSDAQLRFLQAVYNAQQRRYDPIEYDLLSDSMLRLEEYVDIDSEARQNLLDADLLRQDTDYPHRLYSVTPDGRETIGEQYRQGIDYGHGQGDLEESSQHVFAVEVGKRHLEAAYVSNPDSPVVAVVPYYDLDDNHRLDIAGLDDAGEIRVTVEVERVNNDVGRAVPEDFDKMAACDPEAAIWIVMSQSAGHDVLQALNDPIEGEPRVEKTYADTTPPQQFRIDTPGLTAMYPAGWLRDRPAHGFDGEEE